jgi:hypothetical protein
MSCNRWSLLAALTLATLAHADGLRPYVLGSEGPGEVAAKTDEVKQALEAQGLVIAGAYAPRDGVQVLAVTSPELQKAAAQSEFGGYGAVVRVGITKVGDAVQVSYNNPEYMKAAYRMAGDVSGVTKKLEAALGKKEAFGSEKGLSEKDLRGYHYMMMMPYFTDPIVLGKYESQEAAVAAMEKGLSEKRGHSVKVYRVDIPGKKETVFGVGLTAGEAADLRVISTIDTGARHHTPHFPYEVLITDGTVRMLHGKFRIAQSWPDLTMGTFMKISKTPDAIEAALKKTAGF